MCKIGFWSSGAGQRPQQRSWLCGFSCLSLPHTQAVLSWQLFPTRQTSVLDFFLPFLPTNKDSFKQRVTKDRRILDRCKELDTLRVVQWASCLPAKPSESKGPTAGKAGIGRIPRLSMEPSKNGEQFLIVAVNAYHSQTGIMLNCLIRWLKRLRHWESRHWWALGRARARGFSSV